MKQVLEHDRGRHGQAGSETFILQDRETFLSQRNGCIRRVFRYNLTNWLIKYA